MTFKTAFSTITISLTLLVFSCAAEHKNLKAFPEATKDMERHVIILPHKERGEEDAFKVEIIAGKQLMTDGVNQISLGATIKAKPLKGWGFTYYEVEKFGPPRSTMMAVPPNTPKVKKFVSGAPILISYNSRIPIVIYTPKGGEVRYRIWTAGATYEVAK
ncbi:MAG: ecotin family protein [Akkermansiaceae bacterium]